MWTNYLTVLARRSMTTPTGERRTIARRVTIIPVIDGNETAAFNEAGLYRDALIDAGVPETFNPDEVASVAIYRVTEATPGWVECIGRAWRVNPAALTVRDGVCLNCGRTSCGQRRA